MLRFKLTYDLFYFQEMWLRATEKKTDERLGTILKSSLLLCFLFLKTRILYEREERRAGIE